LGQNMRRSVFTLAVLSLAACNPVVPDSAAGVGFSDYSSYPAAPLSAMPMQPQPLAGSGFSTAAAAAAIDKAEGKTPDARIASVPVLQQAAPLPQTASSYGQPLVTGSIIGSANRPRGNAPAGIVETTSEMQSVAKISDEQDFDAVSQRETIESDKVRIDRNRAQYQIDQPTALPQRVGEAGPNIVQFALSSRNPRGTQVYRRSGLRLTSYNAACARYASPDLAQEAFLNAGGPVRDRKGLDPDGDGYACAWDPAPFRAAVQN
jgi:hypothetical protein